MPQTNGEFIVRVHINIKSGQRLVTIPMKSNIMAGDYVVIKKVENLLPEKEEVSE